MKKIILSFIICLLAITNSRGQEELVIEESIQKIKINWETTFKRALKKAKKQNKPILIYFTGSDWCGPCKVLDKKLFHTEKFKKIADESLILYMVDVPRNKDLVKEKTRIINEEISRKYNQNAFPTLILVNAEGDMLDMKKGFYMTEYYYPFFENIIANY